MRSSRSSFRSRSGKHDSDDEAIKGESLGEDHHKDKSNQDISLSVATNTSVTNDTNAETGSEAGETASEASTELLVSIIVGIAPVLRGVELIIIRHVGNYKTELAKYVK